MAKTRLRIGTFEIDDAELSDASLDAGQTLSIPCKSDPDLCMQLDAWDDQTSIPASINGEQCALYRKHYDDATDAWIMRLA